MQSSPEDKAAMYQVHREFTQLLEERGHVMAGGAELALEALIAAEHAFAPTAEATDWSLIASRHGPTCSPAPDAGPRPPASTPRLYVRSGTPPSGSTSSSA